MLKIFPLRISRHSLRIIAWSAFILFFVTICIPLVFFYYLFNPIQVKQMIISQFNNKNYAVVIGGNVEPRSWHGLSLFISDLTVENKLQQKVLHVNTANCQLSWLDLILGHYKIKRMALNGLTIFQGGSSKFRYSDLFNYDNIAKSEFNKLTNLSATNLNWVESNGKFIIRDASVNVSGLISQPKASLNFKLAKYHASVNIQGKVTKVEGGVLFIPRLNSHIETPRAHYDLQSRASYDYRNQELWVEDTRGAVTGKVYSGSINVDKVLLSSYGVSANNLLASMNKMSSQMNQSFIINAEKISTENFYDYHIDNWVTNFSSANSSRALELKLTFNDTLINQNLDVLNHSCNLAFVYNLAGVENAALNGVLAGKCNFSESAQTINLNLSGNVDNSPTNLQLSYQRRPLRDFLRIDGDIDNLDLSKFMNSAKDKILPLYFDSGRLPFDWLSYLDLNAELDLKQLKLSHFNLSNVSTNMSVKDNNLELNKLQANIYDGKIIGSGGIIKQGNSYQVVIKNKVQNVNLQKMFDSLFNVSAIRGRANVIIDTTAAGVSTYQDLHSKMNGSVALSVYDGGFSGVDFSLFLSPENLAAFQNTSNLMTNFTTLKANFVFKEGISHTGNLVFSSPTIIAAGNGVIDFADTTLNYKLKVSSILPNNLQNIKSVSIPVLISGDLFNPQIYIQNMTLNVDAPEVPKTRKLKK